MFRKYFYIVLFAALLISPAILRKFLIPQQAAESSSASALHLGIMTPNNFDIRNEFARAFSNWYQQKYGQSVQIDYYTPGGTNDIKRQLSTTYDNIKKLNGGKLPNETQIRGVDAQIVWGGGDYFFNNELKPMGILQPIDIDPALLHAAFPSPTLAGINLYDQSKGPTGNALPPEWIGTCLSSFGIIYNPDLCHVLGVKNPTTWNDLTDDRYVGAIALADPTHSGSVAVAYMMILQRAMADAENAFFDLPQNRSVDHKTLKKLQGYHAALSAGWKRGMAELTRIAANARYFSDSASQVVNDVGNGDAAAGMSIDFYGFVTEQSVGLNRARYIAPTGATAITPDPIAILYGTTGEKKMLADRFVEFVLSTQGQRLWILKAGVPGGPRDRALCRTPIRRDVFADQADWTNNADPFTQAQGFNERGEWMGSFGDLRTIWTAAWIDDRDDLKSAYAAVLAVNDAARRDDLLEELADLPITMDDMKTIAMKEKQHVTDASLWQAHSRIEWAQKCRAHYQAVANKAESTR